MTEKFKFGSTVIPFTGWEVNPRQPEKERERHFQAVRRLVEEFNLQVVELSLDFGLLHPQVMDAAFYRRVAALQGELGFACTIHLPFLWVDLTSMNDLVRQASVESVRRAVELVRLFQVESFVLHLWGSTTAQITHVITDEVLQRNLLKAVLRQADRSLAEICAFVEPRALCIENLEALPFDVAVPLLERHGTGICLDVGHLAWQGGGELAFLERHGERVREIHLHDAVPPSPSQGKWARDHLPLGQGELDYGALLRKLDEMGFNGCVILENNSEADLRESLEKLQPFRHYCGTSCE
jgi:sugar phosphate isomerase/epimerase